MDIECYQTICRYNYKNGCDYGKPKYGIDARGNLFCATCEIDIKKIKD